MLIQASGHTFSFQYFSMFSFNFKRVNKNGLHKRKTQHYEPFITRKWGSHFQEEGHQRHNECFILGNLIHQTIMYMIFLDLQELQYLSDRLFGSY
jgi:hypothetical protein